MAKEVAKLKEVSEIVKQKIMSDCPQTMSPSARNSRIAALENMLATSSSTLVSMASQLSEAEERERLFSGRGRWNQVRSLAEAKNLMNYLFNLASTSRCQLRDKEVTCREKDSIISELKEKVVRLSSLHRQLEAQLAEMHDEKLKILAAAKKNHVDAGRSRKLISRTSNDGHSNALRKPSRNRGGNIEWLDDMDTSDSDIDEDDNEDEDEDWVASARKKSDSDMDEDEDWVVSGRKKSRRRSKLILSEEVIPKAEIIIIDECCSCSKLSSCKTKKCECRFASRTCGAACGCVSLKCTNRVESSHKELLESGGSNSSSSSVEDEKSQDLVSHGTMLLQSALSERPNIDQQESHQKDTKTRKPLSDIGNSANNPNVPKPPRRKNWRKSTIQLVPVADPPIAPSLQEHHEAPRTRNDVTLRLPRAMDSTPLDQNPPFAERNSIRSDESVGNNKDSRGIAPLRSHIRIKKASDEKENL